MKTIFTLIAIALVALFQSGCATDASIGGHGISTRASTSGPGAGVGARVY